MVAVVLLSAVPGLVNAQKKCRDGNCPKGQVCVNGFCEKFEPFCPPCYRLDKGECVPCRSCCMWVSAPLPSAEPPSALRSEPSAVNFPLPRKWPGSIKIYDMTGRLVRTITHGKTAEACREVEWDGIEIAKMLCPPAFTFCRLSQTENLKQ